MSPRLVSLFTRLAGFLRTGKALLLLFLLLVAALVGTALLFRPPPEPAYGNVSASAWLELVSTNKQKTADAAAAFRLMGRDGALFLGNELVRKPTQIDEWMITHHQQIPDWLKKYVLKPQRPSHDDTVLLLLHNLGTNAAPAVSNLIVWLDNRQTLHVPSTNPAPGASALQRHITLSNGVLRTNYIQVYLPPSGFFPPYATKPPPPPILSTQQQTVVSAPGVVTTNVVVLIKSGLRPIPVRAYQILTNNGSDNPRVISLLLNSADSPSGPVSLNPNLRMTARKSIPALLQAVEGRDLRQKWMALSLLRLTLPESDLARDCMIRALQNPERAMFDFAIGSLASTTNELDRIIPLATKSLLRYRNRTTDIFSGWNPPVYQSLREFSRHSPLVVSQLQELLPEADFYEQHGIIQLLGDIGTTNTVDLTLIRSFTHHEKRLLRNAAWLTLSKLYGDQTTEVKGQITALENRVEPAFTQAHERLSALGPAAQAAVPALLECLKANDLRTVARSVETLGRIGPSANAALGALQSLSEHPNVTVREEVWTAISRINAQPRESSAP